MANTYRPTITNFGLQKGTDRTLYATWSWSVSNTKEYKCTWYYDTGNGVWFIGSEGTVTSRQSIYTPPDNATRSKLRVQPISETRTVNDVETPYWTAGTTDTAVHSFKNDAPSAPAVPTAVFNEFNKLQLDMSLTNLPSNWEPDHVQFCVYQDDKPRAIWNGKVAIQNRAAKVSKKLAAGHEYRVRARGYKGDNFGAFSDYTDYLLTVPAAPKEITKIYAQSKTIIAISWSVVDHCTSYEIEYTTLSRYFVSSPSMVTSITVESKVHHAEITGLESGKNYVFRVRAVNSAGASNWTANKSITIGETPASPTTWSSKTTMMVGEELYLYWVHNSKDASYEKYAELEITVNGGTPSYQRITNTKTEEENESGKASFYKIDTNAYAEGTTIDWRVRTCGITNEFSEWSANRHVDIYEEPTVVIDITNKNGSSLTAVNNFPFYIRCETSPSSQTPIGFHVDITANVGYSTIDQIGNKVYIAKSQSIFASYYNATTDLIAELTAGNIDLQNGISYTVTVTVGMNSGLSATASDEFSVRWSDDVDVPNAEIGYDPETCSCQIRPYCVTTSGSLVSNILLSVYRREYNGEFVEIASGIENSQSHYVIDPHPSLDYARYRIVATNKSTGAVSYNDISGYPIGEPGAIIQWDSEWSEFDASEADEADSLANASMTGSIVRLPYNLDVSDKTNPDVNLVKYAGRKRPVSYYGTQIGETSIWKTEVPVEDIDTIYALRRLQNYMGDVYVREQSGTGYWANITVAIDQTHRNLTIPVTLSITRVEGGM